MGGIPMTDYTLSDLPRLAVDRVKKIRNPLRHNRQLVGVTAFSERIILHTWYCPWGSYSARVPPDKKICLEYQTLTVEKLAQ
jgi:hypothetical protein